MTILFKQKDFSCEDSITISFANLKEKLEELKEKEK
jgi:hypothetical protein